MKSPAFAGLSALSSDLILTGGVKGFRERARLVSLLGAGEYPRG
jgi:hypothetical protein